MEHAPLYNDVTGARAQGNGYWLTARDGLRLRIGVWSGAGATKGTVLLFPGRAESVEKYGMAAEDLLARGYATVSIDWRGQGLADRLLPDPQRGYVDDFRDYQHDVDALITALPELGLPGPWFLLAHSMGGCIGFRALHEGLGVKAATLSAPMLDVNIPVRYRPITHAALYGLKTTGFGATYTPGTSGDMSYVSKHPFEGNNLTSDPVMYDMLRDQQRRHPDIAIGAPTINWVLQAVRECATLATLPSPDIPTLTFMGSDENVVCQNAIRARMARWPSGRLQIVPNARHEVMMEGPQTRAMFFDAACALFDAHRG